MRVLNCLPFVSVNSKIQNIKSAARGFHSFASYRIRILFFCGKLDIKPRLTHSI